MCVCVRMTRRSSTLSCTSAQSFCRASGGQSKPCTDSSLSLRTCSLFGKGLLRQVFTWWGGRDTARDTDIITRLVKCRSSFHMLNNNNILQIKPLQITMYVLYPDNVRKYSGNLREEKN